MIIPVGSIIRLIRWIFTNPRGALRFFLMLAVLVAAFWSFFAVDFSYAESAKTGVSSPDHLLFYVVSLLDIVALLALPFLLQFYDRLAHLPPGDPSIGCLIILGVLALPMLVLSILIGIHAKTLVNIESAIMGSLVFIALGACAVLSVYLMRKRQKAEMIERVAERIKQMGPSQRR